MEIIQRAQGRDTDKLAIIDRARDGAGGKVQAVAWYRLQPISALDGRTAEALVENGESAAVMKYLDHLAFGGFA